MSYPGFTLDASARCPKLGSVKPSLGLVADGTVPPIQTLEVPTGSGPPGDHAGEMVFSTTPWRALGLLFLSTWVGWMQ